RRGISGGSLGLAALSRRRRVVARAAEGMAPAQAAGGEPASAPGPVDDQALGRILRTGRGEPAAGPDQGRNRQLVGAKGASDAAFEELHAGARVGGGSGRFMAVPAGDQAAPARLV